MNEPFTELYKGYLLKCAPRSMSEKRFLPHLVISFAESGGNKDITKTPDHPSFATVREAAEYALAEGKRWVDENA
jgi:hypothetical protein